MKVALIILICFSMSCSSISHSDKDDLAALRRVLVDRLRNEKYVELRELAPTTSLSETSRVENGVLIGGWFFDEKTMELTYYKPPGSDAGHDFVYRLERSNAGWIIKDLKIRGVR